jgi:hypothetical protein
LPGTTAGAAGPQAMSCQTVEVTVAVEAGRVVFRAVTDAQHWQAEENCPAREQWLAAKVGTAVGTTVLLAGQRIIVVGIVVWAEGEGASFCKSVVYR